VFSGLLAASAAGALEPPYEATRRGARCDLESDGSLACRYRVGRDLEFALRRIGEPGARLLLERSSEDGDYRADRETMSGCVFVRHGARGREAGGSEFDYAFVSTRNGFVYQSLARCRKAR
jgi:hypothetical protein